MRVYAIRAEFSGMYDWGTGWLNDGIRDSWYEYFRNLEKSRKYSLWSYMEREDSSSPVQYLVSVSGSVYLHPMEVCYVGHSEVVTRKMNEKGELEEIFPEIEELKAILEGAANACGGTVEFSDIVFVNIEYPRI